MLDQMIHNGKALYITELLLPEVHDSIIHEYSAAQLNWCRRNELQMWSFFFDRKLFYESNPSKIAKYIYPSPTSPDMPSVALAGLPIMLVGKSLKHIWIGTLKRHFKR